MQTGIAERQTAGLRGSGGTRPVLYAWYALFVLILVYTLNFIDRQILAILAQEVKQDLALSDAQLGFLYGTAFAIFYSLFGIPLGRLADNWRRGYLLAIGLALWSVMTIISGLSHSFPQLAAARIGVGIGEASATPAAFAMIAGYFSKEYRGLALSIYAVGAYLGLGLSLPLGGWISDSWNAAFPVGEAPFGLDGWQAAFVIVGAPGILLALWAATLREPMVSEGNERRILPFGLALRAFGKDMLTILPPFTLWSVARYPGELGKNVIAFCLSGLICYGLIEWTGDVAQWIALSIGYYATYSWRQVLRHNDRAAFHLIWEDGVMILALLGFGAIALITYSAGFWAAPYAIRTFGMSATFAGMAIGIPGAIAAAMGIITGGRLSDFWKARDGRGRVWTCLVSVVGAPPLILLMYTRPDLETYLLLSPLVYFITALPGGVCAAVCQDLVLPRMYGTVGAVYLLSTTMMGLAVGPYLTGKIAMISGSLSVGVMSMLVATPIALVALGLLSRRTADAEATKDVRALEAELRRARLGGGRA